ncbi:MAG TPA: DUF2169 domain-containing protein, partial [Polyangiaceae bacterium]|nr:DUF2169 domain-containing protein [Polyangiaceae bacterium]
MDILNQTQFPFLEFESKTPNARRFHTLVVEAAFAITPDGLVQTDHDAVSIENTYTGEPGRSSLTWEAPLAPFKRATDIHVHAVTRTPKPLREWLARVRVGSIEKRLRVRGPHVWRHRDGAWQRTLPQPCREVPICYELAFGGGYEHEGESVLFEENPYGTGWIHEHTPTDSEIAAPQVIAADEPEHEPGKTYRPQGLLPIAPSWEPRLSRAGTLDEQWEAERWPLLPRDFSYWHYSSASPGLVCRGYLRGDESVELENLGMPGITRWSLPGLSPMALMR